jgi:uncharacterized protein (DUF1330 family)
MTAHVVAVIDVTHPETFRRYVEKASEALAKHGGRVIAVGAPDGEPK